MVSDKTRNKTRNGIAQPNHWWSTSILWSPATHWNHIQQPRSSLLHLLQLPGSVKLLVEYHDCLPLVSDNVDSLSQLHLLQSPVTLWTEWVWCAFMNWIWQSYIGPRTEWIWCAFMNWIWQSCIGPRGILGQSLLAKCTGLWTLGSLGIKPQFTGLV